jgi:hypothetical protein
MSEKTFFVISNGSNDVYQDNTLTNFKNKLPEILELPENENWVAAVESVGFSCDFKNVYLPDNKIHPSFMISNCNKNIPENLANPCEDIYEQEKCGDISFNFTDNEDGENCVWKKFRFEDKIYTAEEISDFFYKAQFEIDGPRFSFNEKTGVLSAGTFTGSFMWFIVHPSMVKTFGIPTKPLKIGGEFWTRDKNNRYVLMKPNEYGGISYVSLNIPFTTYYKNEKYFAYYINMDKQDGIFLTSDPSNVFTSVEKRHPRLVRIICDNIKPQIFNSSYSQDLIVFCPDFEKIERYYFHEFENKQYVSIANSVLSDFEINIVDEENSKLQLLSGVPSIIKLSIKKMEEESFNVRLTSTKNRQYRSNKNSSFKVKLPNTLYLDRDWTVCLTYINHPNIFTTFHENENTRKILFKQAGVESHFKLVLSSTIVFDKDSIIKELNQFFNKMNVGSASYTNDKRVKLTFNHKGVMVISNFVLKVIGYNEYIDNTALGTRISIDPANSNISTTHDNKYVLEFKSNINLDVLKPDYMIAYSNIVSSTIIGGAYNKILRIIPIYKSEDDYVIKEFHHKEYIELQNTEISEIEIELRAHDGTLVNFGNKKDVILNLEFRKRKLT